jgi:hypothetical protein
MFGHRQPDPMSRVRPAGRLGPHYTITYAVPGPDGLPRWRAEFRRDPS